MAIILHLLQALVEFSHLQPEDLRPLGIDGVAPPPVITMALGINIFVCFIGH